MTIDRLRSVPLVFVDDLDQPEIDSHDLHHLTRSLRVRIGDPLTLSDGTGRWRSCRLGREEPSDLGPIQVEPKPAVTMVAFALAKGDRSDLIVQKLTELAVTTIIPMTTERTVLKWDAKKAAKNLERHCRIAREAAMQSRNVWLPEIRSVATLSVVMRDFPDAVLAEPGLDSTPLIELLASDGDSVPGVLIGPEGGFSPAELEGRRQVALPGNILRTETAAIAAGVLLRSASHQG